MGWAALLFHITANVEGTRQAAEKGSAGAPLGSPSLHKPQELLLAWDQDIMEDIVTLSQHRLCLGYFRVPWCACVGFPPGSFRAQLGPGVHVDTLEGFLHASSVPIPPCPTAIHFLFSRSYNSSMTGLCLPCAKQGTAGDRWLFGLFSCCLDILFACLSPDKIAFQFLLRLVYAKPSDCELL